MVLSMDVGGDKKPVTLPKPKVGGRKKTVPPLCFLSRCTGGKGCAGKEYRHLEENAARRWRPVAFIHFQYALSMDDPKAEIAELEKLAEN